MIGLGLFRDLNAKVFDFICFVSNQAYSLEVGNGLEDCMYILYSMYCRFRNWVETFFKNKTGVTKCFVIDHE